MKDGRPDPRWPRGRVVRLEDYVRSEDVENSVPKHLTGRQRLHHLYWEINRVDMGKYIGKELPVHVRLDVADVLARLEADVVAKAEAAPAVAGK
jgi:hypothetical protein